MRHLFAALVFLVVCAASGLAQKHGGGGHSHGGGHTSAARSSGSHAGGSHTKGSRASGSRRSRAKTAGPASKSSKSEVHVNGYSRKNGTHVAPHYRSAPNGTKRDNWSAKGNVNPHTGKPGTKDPNTPAKPD